MALPDLRDLSALTLFELKRLREQIDSEIQRRQDEGRHWLREHNRGLVERSGPLYRNPRNSAETWAGRGPRPQWLEQALAQGHSLDSLSALGGVSDDALPAPSTKKR